MRYRGKFGDQETCIPIEFMTEEEVDELHDRVAFAFRAAGLTGAALDTAIAAAFSAAITAIESDRRKKDERRNTLRLVE